MTKRCLDEGILQAYIDGELSPERAAEAATHLAACDACAAALCEVESESSFFAAAFGPDETMSVPTEVLRARIGAAVAQLEESAPAAGREGSNAKRLGGLLASLSGLFAFTPRSAAAFAGVLVAVAAGVVYFSAQRSGVTPGGGGVPTAEIAKVDSAPARAPQVTTKAPEASTTPQASTTPEATPTEVSAPPALNAPKAGAAPVYAAASYNTRRRASRPAAERQASAPAAAAKEEVLPGEKDYQTAIASLERTIKLGGDASLRPALRADYERNLALLDAAISQTRTVASKNPKDKDAVGFLMAAYQSKVELLTQVADQAQVATLGR